MLTRLINKKYLAQIKITKTSRSRLLFLKSRKYQWTVKFLKIKTLQWLKAIKINSYKKIEELQLKKNIKDRSRSPPEKEEKRGGLGPKEERKGLAAAALVRPPVSRRSGRAARRERAGHGGQPPGRTAERFGRKENTGSLIPSQGLLQHGAVQRAYGLFLAFSLVCFRKGSDRSLWPLCFSLKFKIEFEAGFSVR